MNATRTPSKATIAAVMSALGKRNKGKPKRMTPAEREQRRNAGIASAKARGYSILPRKQPKSRRARDVLAQPEPLRAKHA